MDGSAPSTSRSTRLRPSRSTCARWRTVATASSPSSATAMRGATVMSRIATSPRSSIAATGRLLGASTCRDALPPSFSSCAWSRPARRRARRGRPRRATTPRRRRRASSRAGRSSTLRRPSRRGCARPGNCREGLDGAARRHRDGRAIRLAGDDRAALVHRRAAALEALARREHACGARCAVAGSQRPSPAASAANAPSGLHPARRRARHGQVDQEELARPGRGAACRRRSGCRR